MNQDEIEEEIHQERLENTPPLSGEDWRDVGINLRIINQNDPSFKQYPF